MDGIAVKIVQQDLGVSGAGWEQETAGLICEDLAGGDRGQKRGEAVVCSFTLFARWWEDFIVGFVG